MFRTPDAGSELLHAARSLGDSQSQYLGLLPYAAWEEYASEQRILCAMEETATSDSAERLVGYTAFRLPRQTLALTHLAVAPSMRRQGVAQQLIDELRRRYPDRKGISARCRRDYPASRAWPRLGFVARGDRKGRSADGHLLTDWWYDFGHPDLLTWEGGAQSTTPVVIDTNVFLALHGSRADKRIAQVLAGAADRIQILVTPELNNELNRNPDAFERQRLLQIAAAYPPLAVDPSLVNDVEANLIQRLARAPVSVQDCSDVRHVAYALAAGIGIVVTHDRTAKSRLSTVARELGNVVVTNPSELVVLLDEKEDQPAYAPRALKETGYTFAEAGADSSALNNFINTAEGERRTAFRDVCECLARARPRSHRLILQDTQANSVGLIGTAPRRDMLEVLLLRTRPCGLRSSVAAQLVGQLRVLAAQQSLEIITVLDNFLDSAIYDALLEDGFHPCDDGLIAITIPGPSNLEALRIRFDEYWEKLQRDHRDGLEPLKSVVQQETSATAAYQLEHQLRPLRLLDAPLDTWILPIKPAYAMELFGYPAQLFERHSELGIQREHVFFRGAKSGESPPGRILWYASSPESAIFAISTLVEVRDLPPEIAYRKFKRLGVYDLKRLEATASSTGTIRALRITDTELLTNPIPLRSLRRLEAETGRTLQLVSASKIDTAWFSELMREASAR
ncbi:GNAT family N-acetyltransferase [Mycobacterium marinum]|uniref:GNAT family N-acetyltransferase n=1 Tax=Mycobacterium marinum TaxID=1781 RepID=UPI003568CBF4